MDLIDGITEHDVERFTEGDCFVLAKRLHRVAFLPIHTFLYGNQIDLHAFVMHGNNPLDVMGLWNVEDFKNEWRIGSSEINISKPVAPQELAWGVKLTHQPTFGHYSYRRAREVADILLDKFVH